MSTLNFKEAYQRLTRQSVQFTIDRKIIDIEQLLDIFISEYQDIFIENTDKKNPNSDILLLEYGHRDQINNSKDFVISVKRLFLQEDRDEFQVCGYEIHYDSEEIGLINDLTLACKTRDSCSLWKKGIKESKGFENTLNKEFKKCHFKNCR